jgi:DNA-binding FrmR family transcriptional regulator
VTINAPVAISSGEARGHATPRWSLDILTQVSAATRALQSFSLGLLDEHLAGCVVDAAQRGGSEAEEKVREASDAIARLVRS